EMHALGRAGVEPAQVFEFPARAGLEARDALLQAILDGGVVAHIEVQVAQLFMGSPIASVKDNALANRKRASDYLASLPRNKKTQTMLPPLPEEIEERSIQVLPAPVQLVDRGFVQAEHRLEQVVGDVLTCVDADLDPLSL